MLSKNQIKSKLKQAYWDSNYNPDDLYELLNSNIEEIKDLTKEKLYIRLLETYSWYSILEIIPQEKINELSNTIIFSKLRNNTLRKRYEFISQLLHNTSIPNSGQSS